MGRRKPFADESLHSSPQNSTMLASPTKSAMPEVAHGETKVIQSMPIARNSEVTEMPRHHRLQPLADFRNRVWAWRIVICRNPSASLFALRRPIPRFSTRGRNVKSQARSLMKPWIKG
jgi:hypothetical protein